MFLLSNYFFFCYSKVDEYGFVRSSDFDYHAYEDFMSAYLKILATRAKKWRDLLSEAKPLTRNNKLKRYVRKGIPSEYRAQVIVVCFCNEK